MNVKTYTRRRSTTGWCQPSPSRSGERPFRPVSGWLSASPAPKPKTSRRPSRRSAGRPWGSESEMLSDHSGRPLKKARGVRATSADAAEVKRAKQALLRRSKTSERNFAKWLRDRDGLDPRYKHLTTSTGRIGHLTGLQADVVTVHYLAECKNVKVPATLAKWWQQICVKSTEWGKDPILMWEPSNGGEYKVNGKSLPTMHIITQERHEELLRKEKAYDAGRQ